MKTVESRQQHTPGPWEVIVLPDGSYHLKNGRSFHPNQKSANARLITASPDLLEACRAAKEHIGKLIGEIHYHDNKLQNVLLTQEQWRSIEEIFSAAHEAIAKATNHSTKE